MVRYDSRVIYDLADNLYARAKLLVLIDAIIGGLMGSFIGSQLENFSASLSEQDGLVLTGIGLLVGIGVGLFIGNGKAFELRTHAQTLLCQVAMEEHLQQLAQSGSSFTDPEDEVEIDESDSAAGLWQEPESEE